MRIKPALHYQLDYVMWTVIWVIGIGVAISILAHIITGVVVLGSINIGGFFVAGDSANMAYSVGGVMIFIAFIFGVGGIREDLRFFVQNGLGRRTTFFATLFGALIAGAAIGLISEVFNLIHRAVPVFPLTGNQFNTGGFFVGWLMHIIAFTLAWQLGAMISLIYYRLSTVGAVVFSVVAGAMILFGFGRMVGGLITWLEHNDAANLVYLFDFARSPATMLTSILVVTAVVSTITYLLITRAQIHEP